MQEDEWQYFIRWANNREMPTLRTEVWINDAFAYLETGHTSIPEEVTLHTFIFHFLPILLSWDYEKSARGSSWPPKFWQNSLVNFSTFFQFVNSWSWLVSVGYLASHPAIMKNNFIQKSYFVYISASPNLPIVFRCQSTWSKTWLTFTVIHLLVVVMSPRLIDSQRKMLSSVPHRVECRWTFIESWFVVVDKFNNSRIILPIVHEGPDNDHIVL